MLEIIDASKELDIYFGDRFDLERYERYIDSFLPGCFKYIIEDVKDYDFDRQCLPIIHEALNDRHKIEKIEANFNKAVDHLADKIYELTGKKPDVTIILYLGLCNAAGWSVKMNDQELILLGVEKIIELDWTSLDDMYGLIYHELGHAYQSEYGILELDGLDQKDRFIWQLYTEGFAMYFEELLIGDLDYFHQDKNGWSNYMREHLEDLKRDFCFDLDKMNDSDQRYFGDWVSYNGYGDGGYYLGAKFVQYLSKYYDLDEMIKLDIKEVKNRLKEYLGVKES